MVPPSMVRANVTSCGPSADGSDAVVVSGVEAGRTKKKSATNTSRRTGTRIIALRTGSSSLGSGRPPSCNTANMPADHKLVKGCGRRRAYTTYTARGSGTAPLTDPVNGAKERQRAGVPAVGIHGPVGLLGASARSGYYLRHAREREPTGAPPRRTSPRRPPRGARGARPRPRGRGPLHSHLREGHLGGEMVVRRAVRHGARAGGRGLLLRQRRAALGHRPQLRRRRHGDAAVDRLRAGTAAPQPPLHVRLRAGGGPRGRGRGAHHPLQRRGRRPSGRRPPAEPAAGGHAVG